VTKEQESIETRWSFIKSKSPKLFELDQTPLLSRQVHFPQDALRQALGQLFSLEHFDIDLKDFGIVEAENIFKPIPKPHKIAFIGASGLEGWCALVFSEEDMKAFLSHIIAIDHTQTLSLDKEIIDQFFTFIMAEALFQLNEIGFAKLSFSLIEEKEIKEEPKLTQDIWISFKETRFFCRLVIGDEFRASWNGLMMKTYSTQPSPKTLEETPCTLCVEAGRTHLKAEELHSLKAGDFVLFDNVFYSPSERPQKCLLSISGSPVFEASMKGSELTILKTSSYHEV
jgi:hypothetical protein